MTDSVDSESPAEIQRNDKGQFAPGSCNPGPHPNAGRPSAYQPEFCGKAANLYISGATDFEVAQELGVHPSTLYRWKAEHPEFREAMKLGKEAADDRVEASLYHRAVGYSYPAVKIMQNDGAPIIVPYTEHVPPDVGAVNMWLTNRRGDLWRAKQSLEHTGKDGAPIEFASKAVGALSAADDANDASSIYSQLVSGSTTGEKPT